MFYGRYEDNEPSIVDQIKKLAGKSERSNDSMTARYCNSGDYDGPQDPKPVRDKIVSKGHPLKDAKVGEYVEGLEHLGKVVSITGPEDAERAEKERSKERCRKVKELVGSEVALRLKRILRNTFYFRGGNTVSQTILDICSFNGDKELVALYLLRKFIRLDDDDYDDYSSLADDYADEILKCLKIAS